MKVSAGMVAKLNLKKNNEILKKVNAAFADVEELKEPEILIP